MKGDFRELQGYLKKSSKGVSTFHGSLKGVKKSAKCVSKKCQTEFCFAMKNSMDFFKPPLMVELEIRDFFSEYK